MLEPPPASPEATLTRSPCSLRSLLLVIPLIATLLATGAAVGGGAQAARASDAAAPEGRLIVFWKPGHSTAIADSRVTSASTVAGRAGARSLVIARPGSAGALAAQLRSDPDVAAVIPDARVTLDAWPASDSPNDPSYASYQAELRLIGVPAAWRTTTGSASVIVAIIDTGTTTNHEDLAGITFVSPFNEITGTTGAADDNGHGTHVTGTIAAQTNNGKGIAGIAPGVRIMPIKALDASGSGYFSAFLAGIDYAVAHGAKIINVSLSGSLDAGSVAAMQPTLDAAYAAGVTIIAAAGNDSNNSIMYPCAFNHVICVAATDNSDAHASFSNANAYVDISGPGVNEASTYPFGCGAFVPSCYVLMSGTSMATPHLVGVAALVLSAHPTDTPAQIETALEGTAVDLGTAGRDNTFGYGRVNAAAAVAATPSPSPSPSPSPVTPRTVPGSPARVAGASGNAKVSVSWLAPASNGGSPITGYTATSSLGGKTCTTTGVLTCTVTGLTNGQAYTFTVKATNIVGTGPASAPSAPMTPRSVPGAPTGVAAVPSLSSAQVSWSAPVSNGGSAITGYTATASPGGKTCTATGALTCTISGLADGLYTVTVKATTIAGTGLASASSAQFRIDTTPPTAALTRPTTPTRATTLTYTLTFSEPVTGLAASDFTRTGTATGCVVGTPAGAGAAYTVAVTSCSAGTVILALKANSVADHAGNSGPTSPASAAAVTIDRTAPPVSGATYHALVPTRLLDTRSGNGLSGAFSASVARTFQVAGRGGVPANAVGVTGNLTVTGQTAGGYLFLGPVATRTPASSTLNFPLGDTRANGVTVALGASGTLSITYVAGAGRRAQVIFDVTGYFTR